MQTLTLTREEDTVRTTALVIPFPVAHVLACALEDEDIKAHKAMLLELTHNTNILRETRIRAAQRVHALEVVLAEIAKYLPRHHPLEN